MHFSARVVWITTFRGYACSAKSKQTIRNVCYRTVTYFKQDHEITVLVAGGYIQREERLIGRESRGYLHRRIIFVEKTYSLIFNLSSLLKKPKPHVSKQNSRLQTWVSNESGIAPVTLDLSADERIISTKESTENVAKRVLG